MKIGRQSQLFELKVNIVGLRKSGANNTEPLTGHLRAKVLNHPYPVGHLLIQLWDFRFHDLSDIFRHFSGQSEIIPFRDLTGFE